MKPTIHQQLRILGHNWDICAPIGTRLEEVFEVIRPHQVQDWQADGQPCSPESVLGEYPLVDGAELGPASPNKPASALRITVTSGPQLGRTWLLTPGQHDLGRDHPLLSGDQLISRQHLVVKLRHGEVTVMDTASANGTRLHGEPLPPQAVTPWHLGDHLSVGGSELVLTLDSPERHLTEVINARCPRPAQAALIPPTPVKIEWPVRPTPVGRNPLRLIAALLPLPIGLGAAYFFHSMMLLLMMAASPLIMLFTAFDDRHHGKRQNRAEDLRREAKIDHCARRMLDQIAKEKRFRHDRFLSIDGLRHAAAGKTVGLDTADAHWPLELRLGVGQCHSPSFVQMEDAAQMHPVIDDIPVTCSLKPGTLIQLVCNQNIRDKILTQIAAELMVVGAPGVRPPCIASTTLQGMVYDLSDLVVRGNINDVLSSLSEEQPGAQRTGVLIIEQDDALTAQELEDLTKSGLAVLWIGDRCPAATQETFTLVQGYRASYGPSGVRFTVDLPQREYLDDIAAAMRRWQPRSYPLTAKGELPERLMPDELGMDTEVHWGQMPTMEIPIGVDSRGQYALNLEKYGPHALVAGTTGSGKSEFLLAYLRALFALNSPDHVTTILIDYKGGATFGPLTQAPHVVGVICDLDVGLAERALIGLRAEIHRREKLLRSYDVASFAAYQALTEQKEALSRLFVIVDEFRVLAEELPEFVSGLVRIAAVGRSLGIHLILATQRPGGVVTADMRANIDLRVCLRVRERADSIDVLESPVAAEIDRGTPGRAFVAVAGEAPRQVQTMYTAQGVGQAGIALHVHPVRPVGEGGDLTHRECPGCAPQTRSARSDLEQTVESCRIAASSMAPPHRPVLPALSEHPDLADVRSVMSWRQLTEAQCVVNFSQTKSQAFAVVDLPELQAQPGIIADASCHVSICGAAKTGRTNAARAIATALDPAGSHTWWVTPDDENATNVIRPDDVPAVAAMMDSLMSGTAPRVLVIDGWEQLYETLLLLNHGMAADDLVGLIARAHKLPMQVIVTGGRALMTSKISALFEMRFIMRQNDMGEYSLAGLRPLDIPAAMPPGRALALPYGRQVHFVECPGNLISNDRPQAQTGEQPARQRT